ncbi:hypothetical protein BT63DRAFT_26410 [Microthyrium microscopicum]|uniref:Mediator of RNA polymerase II transcription subunit 12 n=1 Tax=Microthyrium microscopicum TaxID=703497 RepID=A0A6A6UU84_9PEZI|nr:hypothetical protein BT63DRAFT_26410 [Microthyrium microscopicum]
MSSRFPVGIQQPSPQPLAVHHGRPTLSTSAGAAANNSRNMRQGGVATSSAISGFSDSPASDYVPVNVKLETDSDITASPAPDFYAELAPLPPRPAFHTLNRKLPTSTPPALPAVATVNTLVNDVRAQNMEIPPASRVYPQGGIADFSPWKGKHSEKPPVEDIMNEQSIKSGFQNKSAINNESNTARPSLWSHLKKQGGPQNLSSLFVSLLEKRQVAGRVSGSSTFKPPPRLAMSNTRREAFLHELADPTWPLRKLNRSVPSTIVGRVLLDQCLSKNIPIPRAIWLAKCNGANEMRALKRKSTTGTTTMGSETRWIKDWTVQVEQFLQSVIHNVGEADWKTQVDYAIRLSSHFFSEHLLDNEHYLDWLLKSIETCTTQHLPIWLLLVQIYWPSLTGYRRRGCRLAESFLAHLEKIKADESDDLLAPIIDKLEALITILAISHHGCLILPRTWARFSAFFTSTAKRSTDMRLPEAISNLIYRNNRLTDRSSSRSTNINEKSKIIECLDQQALNLSPKEIVSNILDISDNLDTIVPILLQWASSIHRSGRYRIYAVVRILRRLRHLDDEFDELLWTSIQQLHNSQDLVHQRLFQIVVELVRASQFSVGRFVQHLIAIGASSGKDPRNDCLLQLLKHIPDVNLPEGVSNMRLSILKTTGLVSLTGEELFTKQKAAILVELAGSNASYACPAVSRSFGDLSLCQKFELGHAIRNEMLSILDDIISSRDRHLTQPEAARTFESQFFYARAIMEEISEYPCLADILGNMLDLENQTILTFVMETLHFGHRNFISIGAMHPLFDKLVTTYETIRARQPLMRPFCSEMLDLSSTLDTNQVLVAQVTNDLLRSDHIQAATICSPASDNAGDFMQLNTAETDDEIERILSSGTTMDDQAMGRVFKRIFARLEVAYKTKATDQLQFGNWFTRLRSFDPTSFDTLLRQHLSELLMTSQGLEMTFNFLLQVIIGSSCMTLAEFSSFSQNAANVQNQSDALQFQGKLALLMACIPESTKRPNVCIQDMYRFRLCQKVYASAYPSAMFTLLGDIFTFADNISIDDADEAIQRLLSSSGLTQTLIDTLATSQEQRLEFINLLRSLSATTIQYGQTLTGLLVNPNQSVAMKTSLDEQVLRVLRSMDELSVSFGSLNLDAMQCESSLAQNMSSGSLATSLMRAMFTVVNDSNSICFEILSYLGHNVKEEIFQLAEDHILGLNIATTSLSQTAEGNSSELQNYLRVIQQVAGSATTDNDASSISGIMEKLKSIISIFNADLEDGTIGSDCKPSISVLEDWIRALLQLIIIQRQTSSTQKLAPHDSLTFYSLLSTLLVYPQLQTSIDLLDFMFDVAAMFSDDLTDEQRTFMSKSDFWRASDPRLSFLQGPSACPADAWLGLVLAQPASTGSVSAPSSQTPAPRTPITKQQSSQQSRPGSQQRGSSQTQTAQLPGQLRSNQAPPKTFAPPVQFPLKYWELLPDQGAAGAANDTAISLSLFGTRKA